MLVKWLYRVGVANKMEAKKVVDLAEAAHAEWKRGKTYGKPGNVRCVVCVDAEPFGGRDYLRDYMMRNIPGARVTHGEYMEVVPI